MPLLENKLGQKPDSLRGLLHEWIEKPVGYAAGLDIRLIDELNSYPTRFLDEAVSSNEGLGANEVTVIARCESAGAVIFWNRKSHLIGYRA